MPSTTQSIEKLQKKLAKDPNSLIFFQLAEEHRKEGNLEDALRILKGGLARHPNYWSARVTLGRVYHQLGNAPSAREELEKVVQSVPDNLMANRLLGDIYTGMQLPAEALKRYRIVHMLAPADQDLEAHIKRLESEVVFSDPAPPQPEAITELETEPAEITTMIVKEQEESAVSEQSEETYAPTIQMRVPDSLEKTEVHFIETELVSSEVVPPEDGKVIDETIAASAPDQEDQQILPPVEQYRPANDEDLFTSDTLILTPEQTPQEESPSEQVQEPLEQSNDSDELSSLANLLLSIEQSSVEQHDFDELESEIEEEPEFEVEEFLRDPQQDHTQPIVGEDETGEADELTSETLAELYLNQGFIDKAVKVYQRLLLNDPGNRQILQRLQELNSEDSTQLQVEASYQDQVLIAEQEQVEMEHSGNDDIARRDEERRRKIHTLENWLTTIRRERD